MQKKTPSTLWTVSQAGPHDKEQIKQLFEEVFAEPMSESLWQWKYGNNRGVAVVAQRNGRIIAHYGGLFRDVFYRGTQQRSMQCVDTMVKPSERGSLSRSGPYFLVAREFLNQFIGTGRVCEFGYGFPNSRVLKLGEHLGVQAAIGKVVEPIWSHIDSSAPQVSNLIVSDFDVSNTLHRSQCDDLFEQMLLGLSDSIVGVRNSAYLKHRYFDNPSYKYVAQLVSTSGSDSPAGIVVYRKSGEEVILLDTIGHPKYFPVLVAHVQSQLTSMGANQLSTWITDVHLPLFGNQYNRIDDPKVSIPTSVCTPGPSRESLTDKWFLTSGDAEFK